MVSHLDKKNDPIMVKVGNKDITKRIAEAEGEIVFDKLTYKKIENLNSKKGSIKNNIHICVYITNVIVDFVVSTFDFCPPILGR